MVFSTIFRVLFKSSVNERQRWLEEATPDTILEDLTRNITEGEENIGLFLKHEELLAFESKLGSVAENKNVSIEHIITKISGKHPHASQSLSNARSALVKIIQIHAAYPFMGRDVPLTSTALLRAMFLMTDRSQRMLSRNRKVGLDGIVLKERTNKDRLRIWFWALAQNNTENDRMSNLDIQAQHAEIVNVVAILQDRHLPPGGRKITPLTQERLKPFSMRLAAESTDLPVGNTIDQDVFLQWMELIQALSGDVPSVTRPSAPEPIDFEQFVKFAEQGKMLEVMSKVLDDAIFK